MIQTEFKPEGFLSMFTLCVSLFSHSFASSVTDGMFRDNYQGKGAAVPVTAILLSMEAGLYLVTCLKS